MPMKNELQVWWLPSVCNSYNSFEMIKIGQKKYQHKLKLITFGEIKLNIKNHLNYYVFTRLFANIITLLGIVGWSEVHTTFTIISWLSFQQRLQSTTSKTEYSYYYTTILLSRPKGQISFKFYDILFAFCWSDFISTYSFEAGFLIQSGFLYPTLLCQYATGQNAVH